MDYGVQIVYVRRSKENEFRCHTIIYSHEKVGVFIDISRSPVSQEKRPEKTNRLTSAD